MHGIFSCDIFSLLVRASAALGLAVLVLAGCGTTKSYTATEHLLMSDAVDATVAQMNFQALAEKKVYLDITYLTTPKGQQLIDSDYVTSSLRQQMTAFGVRLVENRTDAELVAEARLGALGFDGHSMTYGIPASNGLSSAASVVTSAPLLPSIPEISLARREVKQGAAKIAVFVFDSKTRDPYWQSGIVKSNSSARDTWIFGVGPLQNGTIYDGARFAGGKLQTKIAPSLRIHDRAEPPEQLAGYREQRLFAEARTAPIIAKSDTKQQSSAVVTASATGPAQPAGAGAASKETKDSSKEAKK